MKQSYLRMGLAFWGFVLIGASGGALGVLLPSMTAYYAVDNTTIGLLFFTSSIGYFLLAFMSGFLLEKLGLRIFLIVGALFFLFGTLTFAITPPFTLLLVTRFFFGVGVAILETGLNAYVLSLPRNTTLLNSLHAFYGAGGLVGPLVATAFLTAHLRWNDTFFLWTLLSLPLLLGFLFTFKTPSAPSTAVSMGQKEQETTKTPALTAALKLPGVWLATLFLLFYVGIEVSAGNWSYTFLVEGQHQQIVLAGWIVSGFWLGLTLGRFFIAAWTERVGINTMRMIYGCIGGIFLGLLLVWLFPTSLGAALGFFCLGFALGPIYPTTVAIMPTLVPQRLVASAVGFLVSSSIIGLALFPWIAGILAQYLGIGSLLPYLAVLNVIIVFFWWILFRVPARTRNNDMQTLSTQPVMSNES